MELFFQFASYQWHWFGLLAMLIAALVYYEGRKAGPQVSPQQLSLLVNNENALILDVRPGKEFRGGHIVDAVNVPFDQVATQLPQLEKYRGRPVVLVCKMGQHAGAAAKQLRAAGFDKVYRLSGGIAEWGNSQMPLVKGKG